VAYVSSFIFNKQTNIAANKSTSIRIPSLKNHVNATFLKSYPQLTVILFEVIKMRSLDLIVFILGACTISFLKVIAHDYPQIDTTRRSHCDHCNRILRWYEIIPIVGYFIVNGKCIRCKNQIDFSNPLLELCGGLLFVITVHIGDWKYLPFFIMLIILGFTDYFYGYVYPIFYSLSIPTLILSFDHLFIWNGIIIYFVLLLLSKLTLLGLGDIETMSIIGILFDPTTFLKIILTACLLCFFTYLINKKRSFRFIPYLTVATGTIYLIFSIKFLVKYFVI